MRPLPKIFLIPIPQFRSRFSAGDENDSALKGKSSSKNFITADLNILSQHARLTTYHKKIFQARICRYQHFLHSKFFSLSKYSTIFNRKSFTNCLISVCNALSIFFRFQVLSAKKSPTKIFKNIFFNRKLFSDHLISEFKALSVVFPGFKAYQ